MALLLYNFYYFYYFYTVHLKGNIKEIQFHWGLFAEEAVCMVTGSLFVKWQTFNHFFFFFFAGTWAMNNPAWAIAIAKN